MMKDSTYPSIFKLPVELLVEIFAIACLDGGYTGASLSSTCREIRWLSAPYRFQSIAVCGATQLASLLRLLESTQDITLEKQQLQKAASTEHHATFTTNITTSLEFRKPRIRSLFFSFLPLKGLKAHLGDGVPRCWSESDKEGVFAYGEKISLPQFEYFKLLNILSPTLEILHEYRPTTGLISAGRFSQFWRVRTLIQFPLLKELTVSDLCVAGYIEPGTRDKRYSHEMDLAGAGDDPTAGVGFWYEEEPRLLYKGPWMKHCYPSLQRLHITFTRFDPEILTVLPAAAKHIRFYRPLEELDLVIPFGAGSVACQDEAGNLTCRSRAIYISHPDPGHEQNSETLKSWKQIASNQPCLKVLGPEFIVADPVRSDCSGKINWYNQAALRRWDAGVSKAKGAWIRRMCGEVWWSDNAIQDSCI